VDSNGGKKLHISKTGVTCLF